MFFFWNVYILEMSCYFGWWAWCTLEALGYADGQREWAKARPSGQLQRAQRVGGGWALEWRATDTGNPQPITAYPSEQLFRHQFFAPKGRTLVGDTLVGTERRGPHLSLRMLLLWVLLVPTCFAGVNEGVVGIFLSTHTPISYRSCHSMH